MSLSQSYLKSCLSYDPVTGHFHWIISKKGVTVGQLAGSPVRAGYRRIRIDDVKYQTSHLAFLYMTGNLPSENQEVDHIDRNPRNDSWNNLRLVDVYQNRWNRGQHKNNTSGVKGVRQIHNGRWKAYIRVNDKGIHLGYFDTREEAAIIRREAEQKYYGKYAP
jgi:hypothetical protein